MIKHLIALCAVIAMIAPAHGAGVNLSRGQGLACEAILCAVGIAIPESHNECRRVLFDWSVHLATLGPFRSKPKCPRVNDVGSVVAEVEMICSTIVDPDARAQCDAATAPPGDYICEELTTPEDRFNCENQCDTGGINADGRQVCQIR